MRNMKEGETLECGRPFRRASEVNCPFAARSAQKMARGNASRRGRPSAPLRAVHVGNVHRKRDRITHKHHAIICKHFP